MLHDVVVADIMPPPRPLLQALMPPVIANAPTASSVDALVGVGVGG